MNRYKIGSTVIMSSLYGILTGILAFFYISQYGVLTGIACVAGVWGVALLINGLIYLAAKWSVRGDMIEAEKHSGLSEEDKREIVKSIIGSDSVGIKIGFNPKTGKMEVKSVTKEEAKTLRKNPKVMTFGASIKKTTKPKTFSKQVKKKTSKK